MLIVYEVEWRVTVGILFYPRKGDKKEYAVNNIKNYRSYSS